MDFITTRRARAEKSVKYGPWHIVMICCVNQGVVSLNLPQIGILAKGDKEKFWEILEKRLSLCFEALMCRHRALEGTKAKVSPIHWMYGAIARLNPEDTIDPLLHGGYSTISLGYIGLYEVTKLMTGKSHTSKEGEEFAIKLMKRLRQACDSWKAETNIGFALYGTPESVGAWMVTFNEKAA